MNAKNFAPEGQGPVPIHITPDKSPSLRGSSGMIQRNHEIKQLGG